MSPTAAVAPPRRRRAGGGQGRGGRGEVDGRARRRCCGDRGGRRGLVRRRGCRLTSLLSKFRLAGLVRWRGCRRRRRGRGRGESGQDDSHGLDRLLGLQARLGQDLGQAGVAVPGDVGDARAAGGLAHVGQAPVGVVDDDRAGHGGVHMQPRPHALGQARPVDDDGRQARPQAELHRGDGGLVRDDPGQIGPGDAHPHEDEGEDEVEDARAGDGGKPPRNGRRPAPAARTPRAPDGPGSGRRRESGRRRVRRPLPLVHAPDVLPVPHRRPPGAARLTPDSRPRPARHLTEPKPYFFNDFCPSADMT